MLRLPELRALTKTWRLPLALPASLPLANALLSEAVGERQSRFLELLSTEPALLLWTLCRAPAFRTAPPSRLSNVAAWLSAAAPHVFLGTICDDAEVGPRLTTDGLARAASAVPPNWAQWFGDPLAWLATSGPQVDLASAQRGESCLPNWLVEQCSLQKSDSPWPSTEAGDASVTRVKSCRNEATRLNLPRLIEQLVERDLLRDNREADKLAALRELAYGASHEINNPLANIATRAQALLPGESHPDRRRSLAQIAAQAFRAHDMISDLMLFAKPPALRLAPCDPSELLRRAGAELREAAERQNTTLEYDFQLPTGAQPITADCEQLLVAVKAIGKNALEALGQGGVVRFRCGAEGIPADSTLEPNASTAGIWLTMSDNGPGISSEVLPHLFDPFYSGREAGRGLGFGLAKAWRIVTDHGGEITVQSELGAGSRFTIRLPAK